MKDTNGKRIAIRNTVMTQVDFGGNQIFMKNKTRSIGGSPSMRKSRHLHTTARLRRIAYTRICNEGGREGNKKRKKIPTTPASVFSRLSSCLNSHSGVGDGCWSNPGHKVQPYRSKFWLTRVGNAPSFLRLPKSVRGG